VSGSEKFLLWGGFAKKKK